MEDDCVRDEALNKICCHTSHLPGLSPIQLYGWAGGPVGAVGGCMKLTRYP